ncbi:nuclear transport factor 2 family protein [Nocardia sputi]|uniref:nuclear transport factor 2 family protein n=1 Tax=Nocardia sputi TaxID=2943705 RepID=UPI0020BE1134|nr:nuclear transport factor 2 family protein [Nocardia sputi]
MPTIETTIRDLADRAELTELIARHSLWVDEGYADTDRLFTEDAVVTSIRGEAHGIEALTALARKGHEAYARTMHSKCNLVIDIDGDTATVRAHDVAVYVLDDKTEAVAAAIHHYRARRSASGWRFDRLEVSPVARTEALARAL